MNWWSWMERRTVWRTGLGTASGPSINNAWWTGLKRSYKAGSDCRWYSVQKGRGIMIRSGVLLLVLGLTLSAQEHDEDLQRLSDQARSALAAKQWEQAAKTLEKLARLAPSVAEVEANLGLALYFQGKDSEALAAFDRARKLNPALPQVDVVTRLCESGGGFYREALGLLEPAFAHPPDDETGRLIGLHLARSYAELKQFD